METLRIIVAVLFVPIFFIFLPLYAFYLAPRKAKRINEESLIIIEEYLKKNDFNWTKRIVLNDYNVGTFSSDDVYFSRSSGIWFDYETKRIAVCYPKKIKNVWDERSPEIYSFLEVSDFELLEGTKTIYRGITVGYGPLAIGGVGSVDFSNGLSVRILFGGTHGVSSISIPLIIPTTKRGKVKQDNQNYQKCMDCVRAILDELGNIIHLMQS